MWGPKELRGGQAHAKTVKISTGVSLMSLNIDSWQLWLVCSTRSAAFSAALSLARNSFVCRTLKRTISLKQTSNFLCAGAVPHTPLLFSPFLPPSGTLCLPSCLAHLAKAKIEVQLAVEVDYASQPPSVLLQCFNFSPRYTENKILMGRLCKRIITN